MKHSTIRRWIFVALLLVLIVGTIVGHAHGLSPAAARVGGSTPEDSPVALQQKLSEISKKTQVADEDTSGEAGMPSSMALYGLLPINILFWTLR